MNKFGFLSSILTWVLFLLQFIPLGLIIGVEGPTSFWFGQYFNINNNTWMSSSVQIPLELFNYGNQQVFLWGIIQGGNISLWYEVHIIGFVMLFSLLLITGILSLIGCAKDSQTGKKLIAFNFFVLLAIILFVIIGIPIYSQELLGAKLEFLDVFFSFNFGFYILLIDFVLAAIAYGNHPIGGD